MAEPTRKRSGEASADQATLGPGNAAAAGLARPAQPVSVFAEDFSLLIRTPRRMRIARSKIRVLS